MVKSWKFWLGLLISVVFLYLFLRGINWPALGETLLSIHWIYLVFMASLNILSFVIRAIRWRYFFSPDSRPGFDPCFSATSIGFMANSVLPLRIGEVVRAVMLARKTGLSKSLSFGTLVLERLFDMLTILLYFSLFIIIYSLPQANTSSQGDFLSNITAIGYSTTAVCVIAVICLILLRFLTTPMVRLVEKVVSPLPDKIRSALLNALTSFIDGLDILKDFPAFVISVVLSIVIWFVIILQTYMLFWAFELPLNFAQAIFLLVVMVFSVTLPAAPGYVGTFHYGASLALVLMGIAENTAKGVAIVAHLFSMFPIAIVGFFYVWKENLSLSELQKNQLEDAVDK